MGRELVLLPADDTLAAGKIAGTKFVAFSADVIPLESRLDVEF